MKCVPINVEYLDHMGNDLDVVNAARVSFHKESDWEWTEIDGSDEPILSFSDSKLLSYLARENHWSPFAHCTVKFRVKAPIFVARQLVKHTVGFTWNEVSRRYVDDEPEFHIPEGWREKAESVKQGSGGLMVDQETQRVVAMMSTQYALDAYTTLLKNGVCPEQARMVLPQNTMTEWVWTGTLFAWARMCQLRLDKHTQVETRLVAKKIDREMKALFPVSWGSLMYNEKKEKLCALLS